MRLTTEQLVRMYNTGARLNFLASGELMPVLSLHGGPVELLAQLRPNPKFHPSDALPAVAFALGSTTPATHVVAVTETWKKAFGDGDEPDPAKMQRGYLESLHEQGDLAVHTCLLVLVIDTKDPGASQVWGTDVDAGTEPEQMHTGLEGANLGQRILDAYRQGQDIGPPRGVTAKGQAHDWHMAVNMLGAAGVISSVIEFDHENPNRWN